MNTAFSVAFSGDSRYNFRMESKQYSGLSKEQLIELIASRDSEIERLRKKAEETEERASLMVSKLQGLKCLSESAKELGEAESKIAELGALVDSLIAKYERKLDQYAQAAKSLYGSKSERRPINVSSHGQGKPRGSKYRSFIGDLKGLKDALETRVVDVDFERLGLDKSKYAEAGSDVSIKLEAAPIEIKPIAVETRKYVLRKGEAPSLRQPPIISASASDPFRNSVATGSLVASLAMLKCLYGVPIYRVAEHCDIAGERISAKTLDQILQESMEGLAPIASLIKARVMEASSSVIHADETTLRVLGEGKGKRYVYQLSTSRFDAPAVFMGYTGTRSSDAIKGDFPEGKGYWISCDGFSGYERLRKGADEGRFRLQCCNFHARKRFIEANESLDEASREDSQSGKVIRKYGEIFAEEERMKNLPPDERAKGRKKESYKAKVDELIALVEAIDADEGSTLGEAKRYFMARKEELFAYLENGYLDMTNNRAERNFRVLCMAKKSFLHCRNKESASRLMDCYSVILTALENGVNLFPYLEYLFTELKKGNEDYAGLCPWNEEILKRFGLKNKDLK